MTKDLILPETNENTSNLILGIMSTKFIENLIDKNIE